MGWKIQIGAEDLLDSLGQKVEKDVPMLPEEKKEQVDNGEVGKGVECQGPSAIFVKRSGQPPADMDKITRMFG